MFQFHEGPIKTHNDLGVATTVAEFQFHEGPIKTTVKELGAHKVLCFNSMKVRLKHVVISQMHYEKQFQFHEGPIKTYIYDGHK